MHIQDASQAHLFLDLILISIKRRGVKNRSVCALFISAAEDTGVMKSVKMKNKVKVIDSVIDHVFVIWDHHNNSESGI